MTCADRACRRRGARTGPPTDARPLPTPATPATPAKAPAPAKAGRPAAPATTAVVAAVLMVLAGCGGSEAAGPEASPSPTIAATVVTRAELVPGQAVPTPAASTVLTLTGLIGQQNNGNGLALDAATIDAMGLTQVSLYEPWVKKNETFQGVWLADLLKVAGVANRAQVIHLTALDDYKVDLKMSDIRAGGIFLATRNAEGSLIPVKDGGPTRIVFVGGVPAGRSADQWIWSLKILDVQ